MPSSTCSTASALSVRTSSSTTLVADRQIPMGLIVRLRQSPALAGLWLVFLLAACSRPADRTQLTFHGQSMGTTWTVHAVYAAAVAPAIRADVERQINSRLRELDRRYSTWKPNSELNRLNRAPVGKRFRVSRDFAKLLKVADRVWQRSEGYFDPTVFPLVDAWGFGPSRRTTAPTAAELTALRHRAGWRFIRLRGQDVLRTTDVTLDLSAIAKGWAVDAVAADLDKLQALGYMVEVGGEVRLHGRKPDGTLWRIGIEQPDPAGRSISRVLELSDISLATSGDYRNYRVVNGQRLSHTIDPHSGHPVTHSTASVTVLLPDCGEADAWATALLAAGSKRGLAIANNWRIPALFIDHDGQGFRTTENRWFTDQLNRYTEDEEVP
ncbi:MAG: FAD:protein FMN transferase [Candidatus Dadabacteria bacterium]|nr:MAG: FAD:protein FMN transferase [Candidatus Dadabacteria bacterium]